MLFRRSNSRVGRKMSVGNAITSVANRLEAYNTTLWDGFFGYAVRRPLISDHEL